MKKYVVAMCIIFSALIGAVLADNYAGPNPANRILYVNGGQVTNAISWDLRNDVTGACNTAGPVNTLTSNASIPGGITKANYDQVWDARFTNAAGSPAAGGCMNDPCTGAGTISPAEQATLAAYMQSGGTVFLMGENTAFIGRNNGIVNFIRTVTGNAGFAASGVGTLNTTSTVYTSVPKPGCCALLGSGATVENFSTDYNNLTSCVPNGLVWTEFPGGVKLTELAGGHPIYVGETNLDFPDSTNAAGAIGIAWEGSDLLPAYANSKLVVWFDWQAFRDYSQTVSLCCPAAANGLMIKNVNDFLNVITPTNTPTPVISLSKSANVTQAYVGNTITFTITYTNNTGSTISNFYLWDTIPSVTTDVWLGGGTKSGSVISWGPYNVTNGSTVTVQWAARVTALPYFLHGLKEEYAFVWEDLLPEKTIKNPSTGSGRGYQLRVTN